MKQILASLVFVVLLFPSFALSDTNRLDATLQTKKPCTYEATSVWYAFNGRTWKKSTYSGSDRSSGNWVTIRNNGDASYCLEIGGQMTTKFIHKKDTKETFWLQYRRNGELKAKGVKRHGRKVGLWFYYYDNGQVVAKEGYI